jgi:hypothetical protein
MGVGDWGPCGVGGRFCDRNAKTGWNTLHVPGMWQIPNSPRLTQSVLVLGTMRGKARDLEDELLIELAIAIAADDDDAS